MGCWVHSKAKLGAVGQPWAPALVITGVSIYQQPGVGTES